MECRRWYGPVVRVMTFLPAPSPYPNFASFVNPKVLAAKLGLAK